MGEHVERQEQPCLQMTAADDCAQHTSLPLSPSSKAAHQSRKGLCKPNNQRSTRAKGAT